MRMQPRAASPGLGDCGKVDEHPYPPQTVSATNEWRKAFIHGPSDAAVLLVTPPFVLPEKPSGGVDIKASIMGSIFVPLARIFILDRLITLDGRIEHYGFSS